MFKTKTCCTVLFCIAGISTVAMADSITVDVKLITATGTGDSIGTIQLTDSDKGLVVKPNLKGLKAGDHGFHIHQNPDCGPKEKDGKMTAGLAAGGHFDPSSSNKHEGPHGHGHTGDLPALIVDTHGNANASVTASRLKIADVKGRSIMIHEGGDNYSDQPKPLGGGGARVACGVIK